MKAFFKLLLCAAVLLALAAAPASAAPLRPAEYFTITDYTVNAVISPENSYDVTETIKVHFTKPRHGIYRDIRFRGTMRRLGPDGNEIKTNYRATVSDIRVQGYEYSVSTTGDFKRVQIGSEDYLEDGDQTYVISYRMAFGKDNLPDFDEVNFNIIGTDWPVPIDHVRFGIALPDDFDAGGLGFSTGPEGASGYDPGALKFSVSGKTISGELTSRLGAYEGLTVRMALPEGYFKVPDNRIPDWLMMGFLGLIAAVSVLLFCLYGRDEKPVDTVEFSAPDGLTPAEIGYINDGVVDNRDVVSLLLYWADKGYLAIKEEGGAFTLIKAREMDAGARPFEAQMFRKLFLGGDTVTTDDLKYTFYTTVNTTKSMVADSFERGDRRVFTKASTGLKPLMSFLTALPVMLTLFMTFSRNGDDLKVTALWTGLVGAAVLLPVYFLIGTLRRWRAYKPSARVALLILELAIYAGAVAGFLYAASLRAYEPMLPWFAAACTLVMGLVAVFIIKRTPKGVEWLGKINGFRNFIEMAERDRIVALVEQNPNYFYSVLPYAYVLNVTDKWAKKFETITLEPPQWYFGYSGRHFNSMLFMYSLNHSMHSLQSSMTSVPQSRGGGGGFGGGGFSGGGFSGGGGGGGGGGSW